MIDYKDLILADTKSFAGITLRKDRTVVYGDYIFAFEDKKYHVISIISKTVIFTADLKDEAGVIINMPALLATKMVNRDVIAVTTTYAKTHFYQVVGNTLTCFATSSFAKDDFTGLTTTITKLQANTTHVLIGGYDQFMNLVEVTSDYRVINRKYLDYAYVYVGEPFLTDNSNIIILRVSSSTVVALLFNSSGTQLNSINLGSGTSARAYLLSDSKSIIVRVGSILKSLTWVGTNFSSIDLTNHSIATGDTMYYGGPKGLITLQASSNKYLLHDYASTTKTLTSAGVALEYSTNNDVQYVGENNDVVLVYSGNKLYFLQKANTPPTNTVIPTQSSKLGVPKTVDLALYFNDPDNDVLTYTSSSSATTVATVSTNGSTLTLQPVAIGSTIITVTAHDGKGGTKSTTFTFSVVNSAPTVTLSSPTNNLTLYENDSFNIAGTAIDTDPNQSVTVYYQIDDNPKKVLAANLSQIQIALSKALTFKGGKMFDGITVITGALADGVAHTLKVWAEDGEKASSSIIERTFYVVSNRAPLLTVDPITPNGIIDSDNFKIKGLAGDPDANASVKVSYRINNGNPVQIYNGPGGTWELEIALSQLAVGENTIVVEVIDNYNAKTSKTIKLNKNTVKTPILQFVARYKIEPPRGSVKGVLLFIERDAGLAVKVELSMTLTGEQEQYITLTPVNTAPTNSGTIEDTFEHTVSEEKQNIILKITPSRTDLSFNHKIHLISGAVD
ncbi:hypothetical protein QH639_17915 [Lysinibacillus sp. 1 U-2021]|uniref:hypothetical protein n=1 Tax=Lysinibacillus sp. 1 U-2021 TaxID=3039426 RepID=UPI0024814535|nr:hypothetical protein [Lysinibacillus sp. 1 U-2021]WGT37696.1 hypothetical protein QH639_17915 [Lysinibacillus sp. 1 U-2021]